MTSFFYKRVNLASSIAPGEEAIGIEADIRSVYTVNYDHMKDFPDLRRISVN